MSQCPKTSPTPWRSRKPMDALLTHGEGLLVPERMIIAPTVWPSSTNAPASTSSSGRNTPTDGAMIMRSGTRSPSPWVKRASMGLRDLQGVGDVLGHCDIANGHAGGAALGEGGEHRSVADLEEGVGAEADERLHGRAPTHRDRDVAGKAAAPTVAVGVRD